jgi:hypothetical protein
LRRGGFPYIISWKVQIWWSVTCLVAVALPLLLIDNTKVQRTCRGKKNKKFFLLNEKTLFFFKKLYKLLFIKNLINKFFRFCWKKIKKFFFFFRKNDNTADKKRQLKMRKGRKRPHVVGFRIHAQTYVPFEV